MGRGVRQVVHEHSACGVFETFRMEKGMKIMGMTTRTEYEVTNGEFGKCKVRLCSSRDQQVEGLRLQFNQRDIYSPVLKSDEVRLTLAFATQHGAKSTRRIRRKPSSTATWRRTYMCLLQRDTASSLKRISTGHGRLPEHGITVSLDGWS